MNTSRILLGMLLIVGAAGALAGGTAAFFSDTETSTGNSFTAGAFDLKIDNDSYYNGNRCTNVGTPEDPQFQWVGPAAFPIEGTSCETSFPASDLEGHVFFNFTDIKPDDHGEDTISVHVENDAWACMDLTLTSNDDNQSVDPEIGDGDSEDIPEDTWDGELAQNLEFFWWADDGDNVFEEGEEDLSGGVKSLLDLATTTGSFSIRLSDPTGNAWNGDPVAGPIPGGETVYIAKAWCFGDLSMTALPETAETGPQERPGFFQCNGVNLSNVAQTDMAQLTLSFRAEQARNNPNFRCNPPNDRTATLTVDKVLLVSSGSIQIEDFTLHIVGPAGDIVVSDAIPVPNLPVGNYTVYEQVTGNVGGKTFITTFSGACTSGGGTPTSTPFALNVNDNVTCTIFNDEVGDNAPPTFN